MKAKLASNLDSQIRIGVGIGVRFGFEVEIGRDSATWPGLDVGVGGEAIKPRPLAHVRDHILIDK